MRGPELLTLLSLIHVITGGFRKKLGLDAQRNVLYLSILLVSHVLWEIAAA